MKQNLLLHIGAHKTGTTTIQGGLYRNRHALLDQGVGYVWVQNKRQINKALRINATRNLLRGGFELARPTQLARAFDACPAQSVIASAENFSYFIDEKPIADLADFLHTHFASVQVLTYLRRQDIQAISHHQEGAKPRRRLTEGVLYGHSASALPDPAPNAALYLDYNRRIGRWLDVFGEDRVRVRVLERNALKDGDVWSDFLDIAGVDADRLTPAATRNASMGGTKTRVGHMMNARGVSNDLCDEILAALPDDARAMPSRADAEAFYAPYRQSNIDLHARLGGDASHPLFSEDFSTYPDAPAQDWEPQNVEAMIGALLDVIRADDVANTSLLQRAKARVAPPSRLSAPVGRIRALLDTLRR